MPNTLAPDSVADGTILGVKISVNPRSPSAARKPAALAAEISNGARSRGCRSVAGAPSRIAGSDAVTAGRYRSNGGAAAGPDSGVITGSVSSAPPGACGLAVTVPSIWITVSSGSAAAASIAAGSVSTACARPERSRTIRKVIDLSWRLRCSQPAIFTCWPAWAGRSAASVREIITTPRESRDPLGVRARRELAVPPHFRRRRPLPAGRGLVPARSRGQAGGALATAHGGPVSPRTQEGLRGRSARPPSQLVAALSGSRDPGLLVSVSALASRIATAGPRGSSAAAMIAALISRNCPSCSGVMTSISTRRTCSTCPGAAAAVGGAVRAANPAALLQPGDGVRQAALAGGGCLGELAHPQCPAWCLGQPHQDLVVAVRDAGALLQLPLDRAEQ